MTVTVDRPTTAIPFTIEVPELFCDEVRAGFLSPR
jgi:hypothetical protein